MDGGARSYTQRRTDPLLCYLWHARNADEHTLQSVAQFNPGSIKEVSPTPEELQQFHDNMAKQPLPYAPLALLEIVYPHVALLDVVDHGQRYPAPKSMSPGDAGLQALAEFEKILTEAQELIT